MHPLMTQDLAKIRIQELHEQAARERLVRAATADRPRSIDIVRVSERLRTWIFGGMFSGGRPAASAEA
jgi:hypothetical protein